MKTLRAPLLLAACASLAVSHLQAQVADIIILEKMTRYYQTSATTTTYDGSQPFRFDVAVTSLNNDVSGISAPKVTLAAGSNAPSVVPTGHNGGYLVSADGEWRYGYPDAVGWLVETSGQLDSLFANGTYSILSEGHTYSLSNTSGGFPGAIPLMTMSGGSWIGGKYVIDASSTLTITTSNNFSGFGSAGIGGFVNLDLDGSSLANDMSFSRIAPAGITPEAANNNTNNFATFTIAASQLALGDHEGSATFARIVSQDTSQAGVFAVAWWGNETSFTVSVVASAVPEPSTYAALAGLAAMGLVAWQRRRQVAVA